MTSSPPSRPSFARRTWTARPPGPRPRRSRSSAVRRPRLPGDAAGAPSRPCTTTTTSSRRTWWTRSPQRRRRPRTPGSTEPDPHRTATPPASPGRRGLRTADDRDRLGRGPGGRAVQVLLAKDGLDGGELVIRALQVEGEADGPGQVAPVVVPVAGEPTRSRVGGVLRVDQGLQERDRGGPARLRRHGRGPLVP